MVRTPSNARMAPDRLLLSCAALASSLLWLGDLSRYLVLRLKTAESSAEPEDRVRILVLQLERAL